MTRVLLITSDFLPQVGGISLMMHHLANAFADRGIEVAVVAPMRRDTIHLEHQYRVYPDPQGSTQMVALHQRRREDARLTSLLASVVADFQPTFMLLGHWHGYDAAALAVRERYGIPLAAYFHGYDLRAPFESRDALRQRLAAATLRSPTRRQRVLTLAHRADHLLANSHYTAALVARAALGRVACVTGCGLPDDQWRREFELTPRYDPALKVMRRHALGLDGRPTVTFVGRLVASKNIDSLLRAIATLTDVQCIVIGDGPEKDQLASLVAELEIGERVMLTGCIDEEKKWEYLRASDVHCLPSKQLPRGSVEGFGIVLLEAGAAGTPVVAAASGGMVDVVEHERSGMLVDPHDPSDIAAQIQRLLYDQALSARCVHHARRAITTRFNWNVVAAKVIKHVSPAPAHADCDSGVNSLYAEKQCTMWRRRSQGVDE